MVDNAQPMEISELRATIKQVVQGQPVPDKVMQQARGRFQTMCQEAAGYEFTEADLIRAVLSPSFDVLSPSFERKRGCGCQAHEGRWSPPVDVNR